MTTSIDTDSLRAYWRNTRHQDTNDGYCDTCGPGNPPPCDWSLILDDLHACLDRIDWLESHQLKARAVLNLPVAGTVKDGVFVNTETATVTIDHMAPGASTEPKASTQPPPPPHDE